MFINTSKIQFESNSQPSKLSTLSVSVVYQYVKDTIWKQFTTNSYYKVWLFSCLSIRQRYNLKAIHNYSSRYIIRIIVVYQYVKDTIWKQFTTYLGFITTNNKLFINTSKIQFESNSQLYCLITQTNISCLSIRQRYNLKAIHNRYWYSDSIALLFINTSKIQFESNSQLQQLHLFCQIGCLSIRQRYNLKAIHNNRYYYNLALVLFINTSKIQFESNSQLTSPICLVFGVVYQYVKDTIWKQFTTILKR